MQLFASRTPLGATLIQAGRAAVLALATMAGAAVHADEASDVQKLMAAGKPAEALQKADQFLASKPRDPMMRFLRGISLSQLGKTSDAISAFTKLTEDYPDLPEPFNNLAVLYAQQGQYDKARTSLEMAIRTNPSYATAYENLGDVYAKLASQAYSKALQIDTRSAVAPKLAMIRELFPKDHTLGATTGSTAVAAATPTTSSAAAPAAVKPAPTPAAQPSVKPEAKVTAKAETKVAETKPADTKTADTKVAATNADQREVEAAIRAWSVAWSHKDMDRYYAAYVRNYAPSGMTHKAWAAERRARIVGKRSITLNISDLRVTVSGDKASAQFLQEYQSGTIHINGHKSLELVRSGGNWLIAKESAGS